MTGPAVVFAGVGLGFVIGVVIGAAVRGWRYVHRT